MMTTTRVPEQPRIPWPHRVAARVRGPAVLVGLLSVVAGFALPAIADAVPTALTLAAVIAGVVLILAGLALMYIPMRGDARPVAIGPPVSGRWLVMNSPATRVPSHGTNGYGQTYAVDFVFDPEPGGRPEPSGLGLARPETYPGFGREVLAPADGVVVAADDGARDHRCRTGVLAVLFMLVVEATLRDLLGWKRLFGNHVVIRLDDGTHAALAHLQRGSLTVGVGARVRAGQVVARCGNSGSSSEPHVHLQLMDVRRPSVAAGIPFVLPSLAGPDRPTGIPPNGERLDAPGTDAHGR